MEKEKIKVFDTLLSYIEIGEGEPLVILHGWGANIESIMPIVNCAPKKFKVYAYDAAGFGDSEEPKDALSTEDYERYLVEFLRLKNINRATFIGHSFGGKTLSIFAAKHPERVNKLVLVDASGVIPKRTLKYYLKVYSFKFLRGIYTKLNFFKDREEVLKKFYEKFGSDDYQNSKGIMRKTFVKVVNEATTQYFDKIIAPTLLVWGENDDATPLYMAKVFESKIKDSGLVVLKGAGHFSYIDDYSTFSAIINSFLG
ncbi:alpha/beta fold hydrolase [Peptoniphilus mikwangii]|uniref:alpha/beta fold hydrolase n=1 Tax=Peptoniphilus mikwangii TaxID=1354300 RepID=UPI000417859D|nr:alpha/beta hydrolase [Peptoniphilus mikwangii]